MPLTATPARRTLVGAVATALAAALLPAAATPVAVAAPTGPAAGETRTAGKGGQVRGGEGSGGQVRAPVPELDWRSCGAGLAAFQCATAEVPLDYDHPRGRTITIALTRLPASDPDRRIGTLFTNPGGPGGSGVLFVQQLAPGYPAELRARFDILGFDPRGVARSTPATCFPTQAAEEAFGERALLFPVTPAEELRYARESRALARACAETSPERFAHISTANVARDMDLLRQAVGDRKLTYAGYSYGTFLGATYAKLFPHRVRALALDATLEPRGYVGRGARYQGVPVGVRVGQTFGGDQVFDEFLVQCRTAGPGRCSLAALGDPATVARQTLDQLKTEPVTLTNPDGTTTTLTYQDVVGLLFFLLYAPQVWSVGADLLSGIAASQGGAADRLDPGVAAAVANLRRGEDYPSLGGSIGSTCVDTRKTDPIAYPRVADAQDRRYPDFGRYRTWIDLVCSYFPIRDTDAYRGPWRQTTDARVLVLGTRYDPATPYRSTRPYASRWPRASVLTLDGWGHVASDKSACVAAHVTRYLVTTRTPADGTVCQTDVVPFAPTTTAEEEAALAAVPALVGR